MMDKELVRQIVRFCKTHQEHYSDKFSPGAIKVKEDSHYWLTIEPDRIKPGELLEGSARHREIMIECWTEFAMRYLAEVNSLGLEQA